MTWQEAVGATCMVAAILCAGTSVLKAQHETSAAFSGTVGGRNGALDGVEIVVIHVPTGNLHRTRSNRAGMFSLSGLRVGGPYTATFETPGYAPQQIDGLSLDLGETRFVSVILESLASRAIQLERVFVLANREAGQPGAHTTVTREEISAQPTIEESLLEYAALDPRVVQIDPEPGEFTAAGQNSRFNSLQVDGIKLNDQYGISANGLPSQGNPLSMETIEAVTVETAPYEASRSGYAGAGVNAVTRSGSNRFRGSLYYSYRNQNFRAKHPVTGERDPFDDRTFGMTFGGPLIPNQLFFFVGYEHSERIEPAPTAGFTPSAEDLNRIVEAAATYGYHPGALVNPGQQGKEDNKYLAKLDWKIGSHRLSARYSETRGHQPVFSDYSTSGRVSLSGHWYDSEQNLTAWSAQLFSQWSSSFESEIKVSAHHYESVRFPRTRFPQVRINKVKGEDGGTGSVFIGADDSSQLNRLDVNNSQASASGTWLVGEHRLTVGADYDHSEFADIFLQNAFGSYTFPSIDAFEAGKPSSFTYEYPLPGETPGVAWGYAVGSLFLQDSWTAHPQLTLTAGLRFDYPDADSKPQYNPRVEQIFGYRNDRTIDGAYTIAPRFSFMLKFGERNRSRLRGGAGVFQGRAPGVWLSNAYANDGYSTAINKKISGFFPDPDEQPEGSPEARRHSIDLMDEGFHMPTIARANLSFDHRLPWQDLMFSAELVQTWTIEGLAYKNLNLRRTGAGPDGRAIYGDRNASNTIVSNSRYKSTEFAEVYLLTNTSKGDARQVTVSLKKPLRRHWGATLSYTRSRAREVSPVTASTAATNYSTRAGIDPNDDMLGTANYEIRDRVLASLTTRFALVRHFDTTVTLRYEGRSGRPYSFVFGNDVNGDGVDYDNDLFYVPTGRDDPRVRFNNSDQKDAFFAYLEGNPALRRFAGQIVPRNSERSDFQHRVDLKVTQEIPLWSRLKGELFVDVLNLANLLNDDWGRVYAVNFPYGLTVANASYDPIANQYVYRYTKARTQTLQTTLSRWQVRGGVRLRF